MTALTDDEVVQSHVGHSIENGCWWVRVHPFATEADARAARSRIEASAKLSGGACEPVAWAYDYEHRNDEWQMGVSTQRPAFQYGMRNIRPLYATPPAEPAVVAATPDPKVAALEAAYAWMNVDADGEDEWGAEIMTQIEVALGRKPAEWKEDDTPKPAPVADDLVERRLHRVRACISTTKNHERSGDAPNWAVAIRQLLEDEAEAIIADAAVIAGKDAVIAYLCTVNDELRDPANSGEANANLCELVKAYEQAAESYRHNVRLIDIAMHGEENAAKQASACDLVSLARDLRERAIAAEARITDLQAEVERAEDRATQAVMEAATKAQEIYICAATRAEVAEMRIVVLEALLTKALDTLDNYADPTGYTDQNGDQIEADAESHQGLLAETTAEDIRAALNAGQK